MKINGMDISKYQELVTEEQFKKLKQSGYEFVIIKMGGNNSGYYEDRAFNSNYHAANAAKMEIGAYYYLDGVFDVVATASHILGVLKDNNFPKLSYPLFLDVEEGAGGEKNRTSKVIKLLECLEALGFFVGIYGSENSSFGSLLEKSRLKGYTWWVANWTKEPWLNWGIWQTGADQSHKIIDVDFDTNISKYDYAKIIKGGHFNGY